MDTRTSNSEESLMEMKMSPCETAVLQLNKKCDALCATLSPLRGGAAAIIVASELDLHSLEPFARPPSSDSDDDSEEISPPEKKRFEFFATQTQTEGYVSSLKSILSNQLSDAIKLIHKAAELKMEMKESPVKNKLHDPLKVLMIFKKYKESLPNHPFICLHRSQRSLNSLF